jgi:hypothetical protein
MRVWQAWNLAATSRKNRESAMHPIQPSRQPPATLLPGDGIGPEITDAVVAIPDGAGAPFARNIQQGDLTARQTLRDDNIHTVAPFGTTLHVSADTEAAHKRYRRTPD